MQSDTVQVPSATTPGQVYEVRMLSGHAIACTCNDRRVRPLAPCSHMITADAPAEIARLTRLAQAAINRRLRYAAPDALRSVARTTDGGGFLIVTNSGGNAIAVRVALWRQGCDVSPGDEANSVYVKSW